MKRAGLFALLLSVLAASGCIVSAGGYKYFEELGVDNRRDTFVVRPYAAYRVQRNSLTLEKRSECDVYNELNLRISIVGYEGVDSLPQSALLRPMRLVFEDGSPCDIISGEIWIRGATGGGFGRDLQKGNCGITGDTVLPFTFKRLAKTTTTVYTSCIKVMRNGRLFSVPNRAYYLKKGHD